MVATVYSAGVFGLEPYIVELQADILDGKAGVDIVGLPDAAVSESRQRVIAALKNAGFALPPKHVIINLAPADIRKEGAMYDLPMLTAFLISMGRLRESELALNVSRCVFIGELSLSGQVRRVNGVLPMVIKAAQSGFETIFVPAENALEAAVVEGINIYPVADVAEMLSILRGGSDAQPVANVGRLFMDDADDGLDFSQVSGLFAAKRALEIAAAGCHNVLMIGPPGTGKSMLAMRIPSILPKMTFEEAVETTAVYSVAGQLNEDNRLITVRPFRAPHHTISQAGLTGGSSIPRPGEISLANNGVLFLDELAEYDRRTLDVLRQPLESGHITIGRASGTATYPCKIMLVCATNPCPCGYYGSKGGKCTCAPGVPEKYISRISGPLLDRIDIHVDVPAVDFETLRSKRKEESSAEIRERVERARAVQAKRFEGTGITCNARMDSRTMDAACRLTPGAEKLLREMFDRTHMSARAYNRVLKVARTCADMTTDDPFSELTEEHIAEAVALHTREMKYWTPSDKGTGMVR
ncbi:MAG: YifB family Mg chelatase-like AAA ATPase [Clostridia bacterium]|nr:YifB family Mg chelatase-like AAA ATPase [Clostridia bacterium]